MNAVSEYHRPKRQRNRDTLDQPIAVTRFPTQAARTRRNLTVSMRDLADMIEGTTAADKARLPWFKLARFGSERTDRDCLRHNGNVIAVTGLEADYDGGGITIDEAASRLRAEGVAALLYSTPSSTAERPRWRVFAPFAEEHRPEARTAFMERLNGIFDGEIDGASFTLSQAYYGGNVQGRQPIKTRLVGGDCIDTLDGLPRLPKGGRERTASTTSGERLGLSIEGAKFYLDQLTDDPEHRDKYQGWLTVGQGLHHEFEGGTEGFDLWRAHSKASPYYDFRELRQKWASFGRYRGEPVTFRTIIEAARGEWALTYAEAVALFDDIPAAEREPKRTGLTFLSPADCATRVEREYVVKGMVACGDVGCIVGAPGVGKSLLGPHLGYMVAQGRFAFGMRTRPGKVFYIAAEDEHGMRNRVTALHKRHGDADGFTLVGGVSDLLSKGSRDLRDLRAAVERERPALIFLDTVAMAFPGLEENTAEGMGRVVAVARSLTKWGAAVMLIHHDTKDGQQGLPRGHSLLNGALDMSIHLTKDENGIVRGKLTKNRNGPCDRDLAFKIDSVELGIDSDGDPVTAGLCDELDAAHVSPGAKLTPSAKAALDILARLLSKRSRVTEDVWRETCVAGREVSAADTRDSRRKAFKRAVAELTRGKRVIFEGQFCRLANPFDEFEGDDDALI